MNGYRFRARDGNQDRAELIGFLDLVRKRQAKRYLEIGCRNGDTFYAVMSAIGNGGYGLAIDLPENESTQGNLIATGNELRNEGIACNIALGSSSDRGIIAFASERAPFDLILIDGDHRYEGVKADWLTYRDMAPVICFHDIAAPPGHVSDGHANDVGAFWQEIARDHRTQTIVTAGANMGFGILYRDSV